MNNSWKLGVAALLTLQLGCSQSSGQSGSELACNQGALGDQDCVDALGDGHFCAARGMCEATSSSADAGTTDSLQIVTSDPLAGSTGLNFNASRDVVIIFNAPVDPATVSHASITANGTGLGIAPSVPSDATNSVVLTLPPSFVETTDYILTIGTGLLDLEGNGLAADAVIPWTLTSPDLLPDAGL